MNSFPTRIWSTESAQDLLKPHPLIQDHKTKRNSSKAALLTVAEAPDDTITALPTARPNRKFFGGSQAPASPIPTSLAESTPKVERKVEPKPAKSILSRFFKKIVYPYKALKMSSKKNSKQNGKGQASAQLVIGNPTDFVHERSGDGRKYSKHGSLLMKPASHRKVEARTSTNEDVPERDSDWEDIDEE